MNKMVINHLDKLFVTSDAATIIRETEVHHPAAKMIAMAAKMQESEAGDGTNFVISFAGELMQQAESLIKMGLHPSEILIGYEKGAKKVLELLEDLACYTVSNVRDRTEIQNCIKSSIASKQYGLEDFLSGLIAEASLTLCLLRRPGSTLMPSESRKFSEAQLMTHRLFMVWLSSVDQRLLLSRSRKLRLQFSTLQLKCSRVRLREPFF
jgi:chaperonin GroEL (HSP60 family)